MAPDDVGERISVTSGPIGSLKAHIGWPLAVFVVLAVLLEWTRVDIWLADAIYQWEGGTWVLRRDFVVRDILHDGAARLIQLFCVALVATAAASFFVARLRPYRWGLLYLVVSIAVSTLLVTLLKDLTRVECPWSVDRYGGAVPYVPTWRSVLAHQGTGRCFPSGHAGSGFALLSLYFYCRCYAPSWRVFALGLALVIGVVFAIAQQLRGAHFVSHDVWALAICWFVALAATPILRGSRSI
jgi:membrane-associated PAP2 superfamily phosphatase